MLWRARDSKLGRTYYRYSGWGSVATGFTKTEQGAMAGLAVLIVAGLAFQARGPSSGAGQGVWIQSGERWQGVTATPHPAGATGSALAPVAGSSDAQPGSGGNAPSQGGAQPAAQLAAPPVGVAQAQEPQVSQLQSADASAIAPGLIDVNAASAGELERLPGIGPVKASSIVQYRERAGPFSSVEQLTEVSGIGPKTLEKIRNYVAVGGGLARIEPPAARSESRAPIAAPQAIPSEPATPIEPPRANTAQAEPQAAPPWEPELDSSAAPAVTRPQRININTANYERLQEIPGIGPVYARRIMQRRARRRFANTAELIEIKGIGEKTYQKMRPYVTVR